MTQRFMTLADVAETLAISPSQAYTLVRSGELRAIQIGARGQWRVESSELEAYIDRMYARTDEFLQEAVAQEEQPPA
jgi:excisionase family DNA binding protein